MESIYGRRPIIEALSGRRHIARIYLAEGAKEDGPIGQIIELARRRAIPIVSFKRREMDDKFPGAAHQGAAADVSEFQFSDLQELLDGVKSKEEALVVALDMITDPQNLGAIIRTAVAAGADAVLVGKRRAAAITPAAVKASAGLTERATVVTTNIGTALTRLKEEGFWIAGADSGGPERVWDLDLTGKICVVLGAEGKGLSRLVAERCDWLASLPLAPGVDSLNVSAAASAIIYEILRQRICRTL